MTPERWERVEELFDSAIRLDAAEREEWLRAACKDDEELRSEVSRLIAEDERADRDGFLSINDSPTTQTIAPNSRKTSAERLLVGENESSLPGWSAASGLVEGFTPHDAIRISTGSRSSSSIEPRSLAIQRLRGLAITCILITLLMIFWKYVVVGDPDHSQLIPYLILLTALAVAAFFLSGPRWLSSAMIEAIELGMIGTFAAVFAFTQYQAMLDFSLRGEAARAQLVMSHRVLIATILILSYGIYARANWRRVILVVGPIALLPFATLFLLQILHPDAMEWLERMGTEHGTTPLAILGFEAILLMILAGGAAYGAHTTTRLRWQVKEATMLGQYRLGRRLGGGGMGDVYLAEHQFLKRPCALKLIRPGLDSGARTLARFEREVRLTSTLSHPNTVEIYDYGRTEDGTYYYVMEYLPGLSLEELVKRHGPISPGRTVHLLRQVCLALREAHAAGLIHRDIKPSNIFASRRGGEYDVAKLLDFGLVRSVEVNAPHLSDEGQILGTPLFMSPEQAKGVQGLDERSDIYSLGAVAYFLLTGRPPFEGHSIEILIAHARDPVVPPSSLRGGIPADLEQIVLQCLAKAPENRPATAADLERELAHCACAGDWGHEAAARWWQTEGQSPSAFRQPADEVSNSA